VSTQGATSEAARLLTAQQVGQRWQVPPSQVYRLTREGKLLAVCIGRYRRFTIESIEAFERGNG